MSNRAAAEKYILEWVDKLCPGSENTRIYKEFFAATSDKEFDTLMKNLETGKQVLPIYSPNFGKHKLSVERNLNLAKQLGHNFFERIWIGARDGNPKYLTPIAYPVIDIPVKRASQLLTKKLSVTDNNNSVDMLTGQLTSTTKSSSVSYPEVQVLAAMGLDNCVVELMKYRGGDTKGFVAMNAMFTKMGTANLKTLDNYAGGVQSTATLKTYLLAMHIKNSL